MLDEPGKYRFIDSFARNFKNFVHGDILPVRDLRKDGSWRCLKLEDLLFLTEALKERFYALYLDFCEGEDDEGIDWYDMYDKWIKRLPEISISRQIDLRFLCDLCRVYRDWLNNTGALLSSSHFINNDETVSFTAGEIIDFGELPYSQNYMSLLAGHFGLDSWQPLGDKEWPQLKDLFGGTWTEIVEDGKYPAEAGSVSYIDIIRRMYWTIKKTTRRNMDSHELFADGFSGAYRCHTGFRTHYISCYTKDGSYIVNQDSIYGGINIRYDYRRYTTGGDTSYSYVICPDNGRSVKTYRAKKAFLLFFGVYSIYSVHTSYIDINHHFCVPYECEISDDPSQRGNKLINIDGILRDVASDDYKLVKKVAGYYGMEFINPGVDPGRSEEDSWNSIRHRLMIQRIELIIDYDFPAEINSIRGWDWEPEEELTGTD